MAKASLRSPDQSLPVRALLGLFEFAASLRLAVVLILSAATVLGWATFVESHYGIKAVHFGIYGTWWFTTLNLLLAINIFCAAAIRFPWKRHQTGFVITHIGLLTLLFGVYLHRRSGIDAQLFAFEGNSSSKAWEDSQHFELVVRKPNVDKEDVIHIPFAGGPFNWSDFFSWNDPDSHLLPFTVVSDSKEGPKVKFYDKLYWFPWSLNRRDRGVVYDHEGIKLEVLDYYANSTEVQAPRVQLKVSAPQAIEHDAEGRERKAPTTWVPVDLQIGDVPAQFAGLFKRAGAREARGGGTYLFMLSGSADETVAFRNSAPEGKIGPRGQIVLYVAGEKIVIDPAEKLEKGRFPLGKSGLEAEVTGLFHTATLDPKAGSLKLLEADAGEGGANADESPGAELLISKPDGKPQRLSLFANIPEFSSNLPELRVYGSYWFDRGELSVQERMAGKGGSRIDILQDVMPEGASASSTAAAKKAPLPKLYYRYWNGKTVATIAELPTDGTKVNSFKMPIAQLEMFVDQYTPLAAPGKVVLPLPFNKDNLPTSTTRAAKIRITVDGKTYEQWVVGMPPSFAELNEPESARPSFAGDGRTVQVRMPLDSIDLNFQVRVNKFEMKLDPGTSQPSHYTSYIDFLDPSGKPIGKDENLKLTMNAPIDFREPETGRPYRLFQESFNGPFRPGEMQYEKYVPASSDATQLFASVLTFNYDPGRAIRNLGIVLVISGIFTMFYMRAYFFKRTSAPATESAPGKRRGSGGGKRGDGQQGPRGGGQQGPGPRPKRPALT